MAKKISPMHARVQAAANKKREEKLLDSLDKEFDPVKFKEVTKGLKMPANPFWDEINDFNRETVAAVTDHVFSFTHRIYEAIQDPTHGHALGTNKRLETLIVSVNLDFTSFQERMAQIHSLHSSKTGACQTQDDVLEVFNIQTEYTNAYTIYTTNVVPAITEALQIVGDIGNLIDAIVDNAQQIQEHGEKTIDPALQDPTVLSDVEFKEIPNV
jgi:hypothetical protein